MKFKKLKQVMDKGMKASICVEGKDTKNFESFKDIPDDYDNCRVVEVNDENDTADITIILEGKVSKKKSKDKTTNLDDSDISDGIRKVDDAIKQMEESDEE